MPLVIFLLLPLLFLLIFLNVATLSFTHLGLSPNGAILFLTASVLGSMINIPLSRRQVTISPRRRLPFPLYFFYYPPAVHKQTIYFNVGGAGLPVIFSIYLLFTRSPFLPAFFGIIVVAIVAKLIARPVQGVGIVMPAFIPPIAAAAVALILASSQAAPVAYVAGTLGTLIGADLLNWRKIQSLGAHAVSIGGAGIFDGIFLVGIVAAFLG
ncbi:MAG: DUF1614 domain-containing protein [Peptococcaceae bacterium]